MTMHLTDDRLSDLTTGKGYLVVDVHNASNGDVPVSPQEFARSVLDPLATPIEVYVRNGIWKAIGVDPTIHDGRVGGIGLIPLHIDCVNTTYPPDFVSFYCQQEDPLGGGETMLVDFRSVLAEFEVNEIEQLKNITINEGRFFDLINVGKELKPFPLIQTSGKDVIWVRYTGKARDVIDGNESLFAKFERLIVEKRICFSLRKNEMLIINQHFIGHGRARLGLNQTEIPNSQRRMLYQMFYRAKY